MRHHYQKLFDGYKAYYIQVNVVYQCIFHLKRHGRSSCKDLVTSLASSDDTLILYAAPLQPEIYVIDYRNGVDIGRRRTI